jgi:hypothetical protein
MYTKFWWVYQTIKHLQDVEVHGRANIKRDLKEIRRESMDLIQLAHNRDEWWTLVKE